MSSSRTCSLTLPPTNPPTHQATHPPINPPTTLWVFMNFIVLNVRSWSIPTCIKKLCWVIDTTFLLGRSSTPRLICGVSVSRCITSRPVDCRSNRTAVARTRSRCQCIIITSLHSNFYFKISISNIYFPDISSLAFICNMKHTFVKCNDTISWQGCLARVMRLNRLYFCGICLLLSCSRPANYKLLSTRFVVKPDVKPDVFLTNFWLNQWGVIENLRVWEAPK